MFTTGTTGKPKGVVWTHANVLWGSRYSAQVYGHRADDISLISLPLFHVVGLCWSFLPVLWAGGTAVLQPRFSASRFWPASLKYRATLASHVLFTSMALQSQSVPDGHFYRQWTVGRGDSKAQSYNRIPAFMPSWGMTELVAPGIYGDPHSPPAEGALGRPSLAHQVRICDPDGGLVKPGETGELTIKGVRGLSIFKEYDGNPEATASAFDAEGFFRTGDRVTLLEDGWIKFSDRASDIIKVGGEGVSPSEIESVVRGVPGVRDVAVVAAEDATYGQVPVAFVEAETMPDRDLEGDILASCRSSLARVQGTTSRRDHVRIAACRKCEDRKSQAATNALIGLGSGEVSAGMRRSFFVIVALASVGLGMTSPALAQSYPTRPVRLITLDGGRWLARHYGAHDRPKSFRRRWASNFTLRTRSALVAT